MTWNPSQTIEVNALAPDPNLALRFVEHEVTTIDPRKGWATPRKRPRRVHKKLAARSFLAHHKGVPTWSPASGFRQQAYWEGTAPKLCAWMSGEDSDGWCHDIITARVTQMAFDEHFGAFTPRERCAAICVPKLRAAPLRVQPIEERQRMSELTTVLDGHKFWIEDALSHYRGIKATTLFYVAAGAPPEHPVLTKHFERAVDDVLHAMRAAARGLYKAKRITTQTTYRPYKETAL